MKRTFVAIRINISKQTAEFFNDIKFQLKDEKINWVDPWNIHLTLFFLGDTEEKLIPEISEELKLKLKGVESFKLKCKKLGLFKNINNPRVLWFGLEKKQALLELKQKVDNVIKSFGYESENKKFVPHLTLGRIKFLKNRKFLESLVEKYKDQMIQEFKVNEIIFYESKLTQKRPIYSVLNKIMLD